VPPTTASSEKEQLRQKIRALLKTDTAYSGSMLLQHFNNHPQAQQWQMIALYASQPKEVATQPLIQALWQQGKQVLLPRCQPDQTLTFHLVQPKDPLTPNQWGILEPQANQPISIDQIDCLLLPTLAFNRAGQRLGHGQGYYDRTLAHKVKNPQAKPWLIVTGFEYQCVQEPLPQEPWDILANECLVITNQGS
jgi:5-formyltetrahydrofolate cyclo-ligase